MEVILRAEAVESVQAGDKCDFIGTLIAVPEVSRLHMEGGCGHITRHVLTRTCVGRWPAGRNIYTCEG